MLLIIQLLLFLITDVFPEFPSVFLLLNVNEMHSHFKLTCLGFQDLNFKAVTSDLTY